jgi:DNA oxidative demethylase
VGRREERSKFHAAHGDRHSPGGRLFPGLPDRPAQEAAKEDLQGILAAAPRFRRRMPRTGRPFSVMMSNCGPLGWVSDEGGYRYQPTHPTTGRPRPPMPARVLAGFAVIAPRAPPPEACLINFYDKSARMGLHQDRDEEELSAPVISLSLGDTALFRVGGPSRNAANPLRSPRLGQHSVACRRRPPRLPRRRPHHRRLFDAAPSRRPDQSDASACDQGIDLAMGLQKVVHSV